MTWNVSWEGRATDFIPDLLNTLGKPGRMAQTARDALWEAVQKAGEHDVGAWVSVKGYGWEHPDNPGLGQFTITMMVSEDPAVIHERQMLQQPVDLRPRPDAP